MLGRGFPKYDNNSKKYMWHGQNQIVKLRNTMLSHLKKFQSFVLEVSLTFFLSHYRIIILKNHDHIQEVFKEYITKNVGKAYSNCMPGS